MKQNILLNTLALGALVCIAFQSCKKENGIDNETVIKRPYGLYITSAAGELLNTNNGDDYVTVFPVDGYPSRALVTTDSAIFWLKANLFVSLDQGSHFNPKLSLSIPVSPITPWHNVMISATDQDRVYVAGTKDHGIYFTEDNGRNWFEDPDWDDGVAGGGISTFTQLKNGAIYAHSNSNDSLYKKDNKTDKWSWVEQISPLPSFGTFYISHFDNTLVATDVMGVYGTYYSNDGQNWVKYTGLPVTKLRATNAPFDEVLLVGTDSMGIYRLQSGQFVPANNGLGVRTSVYGIVGKDNIYKNGARKKFIYIATSDGLYRSEDLGQNWDLVKTGSYVGVY